MADPQLILSELPPVIRDWGASLLILVVGVAIGWAIDRWLLRRLQTLAAKTSWRYDDVLLAAVRGLAWWWCTLLAINLAASHAPLSVVIQDWCSRLTGIVFIVTITVAVMRAATGAFTVHATAMPFGGRSTIVENLIRTVILIIGALVILQTEGISITPILTALGVGGLAVALALQDTLGNLFAGIHILMTKHIRPGDFIRLDADHDGQVQDVGWRNTTLRTLSGNLVVVPNVKLAGAVVINQSLPDPQQNLVVPVSVPYDSDLERVEAVLLDEAARVARAFVDQVVGEIPPAVRFTAFQDSGINANVVLRVRDVEAFHLVRHGLIKALHRRLAGEGITIPFPTRTVHLVGGGTAEERKIDLGAVPPGPPLVSA